MKKEWTKIALIIGIIGMCLMAYAQDESPEPGMQYQWESQLGKLRADSGRPHVYVFDTYDPMTTDRDVNVAWTERVPEKLEKKLTTKALDIHQRLLKLNDVGGVFIGYRVIMIQTFPLVRQDPLPAIKEILK